VGWAFCCGYEKTSLPSGETKTILGQSVAQDLIKLMGYSKIEFPPPDEPRGTRLK
jgi:hypothetical protein